MRWFPPSVRRKEWRGAAAGVGPEDADGGEGSPLPFPWHGRFNPGCSHSLGNASSDATPGLSVAATSYISWSPSSCGGSGCGHAWAVTYAALNDDGDVASDAAEPLFLRIARLQGRGVSTDIFTLPARNTYFAYALACCSQALAVARDA